MMNKPLIVGISGKMGSGKDTFAELFARIRYEELGLIDVERHAFADRVKLFTNSLTNIPLTKTHYSGDPFYNDVFNYTQQQKNVYVESFGMTIGEMLQKFGTDAIRNGLHPGAWLLGLFNNEIPTAHKRNNIVIIPDVRFPNEADKIFENDGVVFRLEGDPLKIRKNSTRNINHISETALDGYKNFTDIIKNSEPDLGVFKDIIKKTMEKHMFLI